MASEHWEKVGAAIIAAGAAAYPGGTAKVHIDRNGSYKVVPAIYDQQYLVDDEITIANPDLSFEITILNDGSPPSATKLIFEPLG